jgi:hypothetical protein
MTGDPIIRDSSKLRKFQGCAVGCLTALLVVIASGIALYYWASTPGPQMETDLILGADSLGLIHVEGLKEDPGLGAMVGSLLIEIQELRTRKLQSEQVPWMLKVLTLWQGSIDPDDIDDSMRDLPRDLTVSLETVAGKQEPQLVAAVNLSRFPRVLRLMFSLSGFGGKGGHIGGNPVHQLNSRGNMLAFVDSTVMWGQSLEVLRKVLNRDLSSPGTGINEVLDAYRSRDSQWDIYGVILNRQGSLAWVLERWSRGGTAGSAIRTELESQLSDIEQIRLGIDVVDEDSIKGEVSLQYASEKAAQSYLDSAERTELLPTPLQESDSLDVQQRVSRRGNIILINLEASNIQAALIEKLDEAWTVSK